MPQRLEALKRWLHDVLSETGSEKDGGNDFQIAPASSDASFRRYFRVTGIGDSLIAMDAPPAREDTGAFIKVANMLAGAGVNAPRIIATNIEQGFLLLSDLGDRSYLEALNDKSVETLYSDALDALLTMQRALSHQEGVLPPYDRELLLAEMDLFREWYLRRHLNLSLSAQHQAQLDNIFKLLADSALAQPQVFVHRDYHSRNLMVTDENNPGILDFQDAVIGPVTYDLVSLLRDCYITWPRDRVEQWALDYLRDAVDAGILPPQSEINFLRWFDWMGIQRHLKAAGIFARLHLRDGKDDYLEDIPRTLAYVRDVSGRYAELQDLHALLSDLPR